MKRKKFIVIVLVSMLISVIIGCIWYSENIPKIQLIEKIKQSINEKNSSNENNITTIDVTGIELGKETAHEHVYKTMYDEEKHWEECIVCNEKRNEAAHSLTTTWAWGYESCGENLFTKTCTCGYSYTGYKPCVWDGNTYYIDNFMKFHEPKCSICSQGIFKEYYLYSYGVGDIYTMESYGDHIMDDVYTWPCRYCRKSDGTIITCSNLGICVECKFNYTSATSPHRLYGVDGSVYCVTCGKEYGSYDGNIVVNSSAPATYTITDNVVLTNEAYFYSTRGAHSAVGEYETNTQTVSNLNSSWTNFTLTTIAKFRSGFESKGYSCIHCNLTVEGKRTVLTIINKYNDTSYYYPDPIKPTISNVSISDYDSWSKKKTITISGTENYGNTVKVEILDSEGNNIYTGGTNTDWSGWTDSTPYGRYSISCVPELEADSEGKTFKVVVTDSSENKSEQEFTISKIDSISPEAVSSIELSREWSKEKIFTALASDQGIGNVQIAFNNVSDYQLATKNGTEYSRDYKLIGDVYSQAKARVFYKDELNNISSQEITIDKLDNTAPTITGSKFENNKLVLEANDIKEGLGEGSGVARYRFITSESKLENPVVTKENSTEILVSENMIISDIVTAKYVYAVAEDAVGNVSKVYEVEVPQLVLISKVNLSAANGKGEIILDWSSYDTENKYFVIYRKKDDETWKTIVNLEQKLTENKYIDVLGIDKAHPNIPQIKIEESNQNNNIEITSNATDLGTKYKYYIESYDSKTNLLIGKSNMCQWGRRFLTH